ncbi:MAG: cation-translocating P-type ATPase, partial [Candidatus Methanomethylophilaceae archaeon]|nr:cation-translocating P-type ATPase [Candidatus Methanomethylophilaceae archaeon]
MVSERVGEESSIRRMARLIESVDPGGSRIVREADRWATWMVVASLSVAALTLIATGDVVRAVSVTVVFCPCAFVMATPTAIMAAVGNLSRHGVLVKDGGAVERLAKTDVMVLSVSDISPKRADDFINMVIAVYNNNWLKDKNQIMASTSVFIDERLKLIEQELGNVDSDIS